MRTDLCWNEWRHTVGVWTFCLMLSQWQMEPAPLSCHYMKDLVQSPLCSFYNTLSLVIALPLSVLRDKSEEFIGRQIDPSSAVVNWELRYLHWSPADRGSSVWGPHQEDRLWDKSMFVLRVTRNPRITVCIGNMLRLLNRPQFPALFHQS